MSGAPERRPSRGLVSGELEVPILVDRDAPPSLRTPNFLSLLPHDRFPESRRCTDLLDRLVGRRGPRYLHPVFGYSILRQNRLGGAGGATGLANVRATASHSSGLSAPRRRMSSLLTSASRVRAS
jgi:hypothetical protein